MLLMNAVSEEVLKCQQGCTINFKQANSPETLNVMNERIWSLMAFVQVAKITFHTWVSMGVDTHTAYWLIDPKTI